MKFCRNHTFVNLYDFRNIKVMGKVYALVTRNVHTQPTKLDTGSMHKSVYATLSNLTVNAADCALRLIFNLPCSK